jgi:putative acetyltransferase
MRAVLIALDDPLRPDVLALLEGHLADMRATSPPESVHALDPQALTAAHVTFWTAREDGVLLGCAALAELGGDPPREAEVKSMRTAPASRGRGVAAALLGHLLEESRRRGYARVSLETGSQDFFAPARRLYARHGFVPCGPFGSYREDPHSAFMTLAL